MKNLFFLILLAGFASCSNNTKQENRSAATDSARSAATTVDLTIPALPGNYVKLDLSKTGLNATAMAPADAQTDHTTLDDNEGKRNEYIIYAFHIMTGDKELDSLNGIPAELDIFTTQWTLQHHKDYIQNSSISFWNRFLKEDSASFIYTTRPVNAMNQPLRANDKEVYQFMLMVKSRNDGKNYVIRSSDAFDYTKEEMLKLLAIAKSVEL